MVSESLSSGGTFWARVVRTSKEEARFLGDMERMGLVLLYNYMSCISQTITCCTSLLNPQEETSLCEKCQPTPILTLRDDDDDNDFI